MNRYRIETIYKNGLIRGYMPQKRYLFCFWTNMQFQPCITYSKAERIINEDL